MKHKIIFPVLSFSFLMVGLILYLAAWKVDCCSLADFSFYCLFIPGCLLMLAGFLNDWNPPKTIVTTIIFLLLLVVTLLLLVNR